MEDEEDVCVQCHKKLAYEDNNRHGFCRICIKINRYEACSSYKCKNTFLRYGNMTRCEACRKKITARTKLKAGSLYDESMG